MLDADDPFKDLQEQLDKLAVYNPEFFPEGTSANDIVSVDDTLTSTESLMTDDATLCDVLDEEGSETEDDTDDVSNEPIYFNYKMTKTGNIFKKAKRIYCLFVCLFCRIQMPHIQ